MRTFVLVLIAAACVAMPAGAPAADSTAAPPVDSLVARALERAPSIAALRARVAAAREMIRPAGARPNPMIEVELQDVAFPAWTVGREEMSMIGPSITQGIPFPGKRGARRDAARAEAAVTAAELEQLRRRVALDVRTVYARLYALDREREALAAGSELLDLLAATVAQRYGAGAAEQEAAVKAQLAVSRLNERRDDLAAGRDALAAGLNRLLDSPGEAPPGNVRTLPPPVPPPAPWDTLAVEGSGEVATRRAAVTAAERAVRAARFETKPDFSVGAGIGFRGRYDPTVTLKLGIDLPLWSGQNQRPAIRAAERRLEAARLDLRDAEASARAEAARLAAEWRRSAVQVPRYEQGIIPQTGLAFDAARSEYLAGRGDFSTVIEDFNEWLEARVDLAKREAERFITWSELEALTNSPGGNAAPPR